MPNQSCQDARSVLIACRVTCNLPCNGHMQGESGKMSASDTNSAIFVNDTPAQIKNKVRWLAEGVCGKHSHRGAGSGSGAATLAAPSQSVD
jgi:tryptophanyl-tRNA synthetase